MNKMCIGLHVTCHFACPVSMRLEFSQHIFEKNPQISNFMKIRPMGAELLLARGRLDGRT
jgi:hypothetical protein